MRKLNRFRHERELLTVIVKDLSTIVRPPNESRFTVEDLLPEHLPALARLNRRRHADESFARKEDRRFANHLASGFNGFVAILGGEVVGYYWWVDSATQSTFPDFREHGLGITLGHGDVYGSDFFLLKEQRGAGAASDILYHIESALQRRSYRVLWGVVQKSNRAARWTYTARGYTPEWIVDKRQVVLDLRKEFVIWRHSTRSDIPSGSDSAC